MLGQAHGNSEGFTAHVTLKGLLPCVQTHVVFQVGGLSEGFAANRAGVWTLAGMDPAVYL